MLILSRVCAEFRNRAGEPLFHVTPRMLNTFQEAPETIREDPLFRLLREEGSLEAVMPEDPRRKVLENDPLKGTDPTGKRPSPALNPPKNAASVSAAASATSSESRGSEASPLPDETSPGAAPDLESSLETALKTGPATAGVTGLETVPETDPDTASSPKRTGRSKK